MRTTIDLPDTLVERTKISAARRKSTMRELVIQGLEKILADEQLPTTGRGSALQRLRKGYALGNQPLTRDQIHSR